MKTNQRESLPIGEISGLLRPFVELSKKQLADILIYINLLLKWNSRVNLTAVRSPKEIVRRHFGESFFAARYLLSGHDATTVIDLGSGAGFPGLPIAMFAPQTQVTLIEAQSKKAVFLSEVIRALNLSNARVFSQRAETYPATAQLVTMRAVEKFEASMPFATHLVAQDGKLALMIGSSQFKQARSLAPEFVWDDPIAVPGGHSRILLVGTKRVKVD